MPTPPPIFFLKFSTVKNMLLEWVTSNIVDKTLRLRVYLISVCTVPECFNYLH